MGTLITKLSVLGVPFSYTDYVAPNIVATISPESGEFSYTGNSITTLKTHRIDAQTGVYTQSENVAALFRGNTGQGHYGVSGKDVSLRKNNVRLHTLVGTYYYTGKIVNLRKTYLPLSADLGTYTLTGIDSALSTINILRANAGTYNYVGNVIALFATNTGQGHYAISGKDVALTRQRFIGAESGIYNSIEVDIAPRATIDETIYLEAYINLN